MIIDGNAIAADILDTLKKTISNSNKDISLCVFVVGSDYATERFISLKKKKAESVGINVAVVQFPPTITTADLVAKIHQYNEQHAVNGILVQLPLPKHIDTNTVLECIPVEKDVDVLSPQSKAIFKKGKLDILPPVVGSIKEIIDRFDISLQGKHAVVLGRGALVGIPLSVWLEQQGAVVTTFDVTTIDLHEHIKDADIIVSGVGVPGLITPDMIKEGVVLFDAGTSEFGGKLVGDATESCAPKCQIFTPTPGGIGPITVALLLHNLVSRASQ